ncbi:MAG: nickel-dependent hydrogenase large subunit [Betaproteobacteria bacterium]|nr:nickel-dependent hydrogenase large subunit [Betaproteobacteria bacterium]
MAARGDVSHGRLENQERCFANVQAIPKKQVDSGQLGLFRNGYTGHPAYTLPPETNLMAVAHDLDALAWQREVVALHTLLGGKNPHPNFVVGGVPVAIGIWPEHPGRGNFMTFGDLPAKGMGDPSGSFFPRGGLAHWIVIDNEKIANYQCVVSSTWNAGPRDSDGKSGAYEAALARHAIHDPKQPLEVLRIFHSFDPCIACAVHLTDEGGEGFGVKVV